MKTRSSSPVFSSPWRLPFGQNMASPRLHLIGGVVVGIQAMTGEDVIDFSISFVLVHAHGAALFQCGLHIDPALVFQYVRPRNGLENDAAFTAVGMFNDFWWNFWKHRIFLLSLDEWGMGKGDWGVKVLKFDAPPARGLWWRL